MNQPSPSRRTTSWSGLLFSGLLILHLLPIWVLPRFPTQDGPSHQALVSVLRLYDKPEGAFLHEYFVRNPEKVPNEFVFYLMADVLEFLPIPVTEKVLLTAYVILLPVSVLYALRAIDRRNAPLALFAFPFTYNFLLQMGFFNFCFSLAPFFFALGYWWKHQGRMGPLRVLVFAFLVLWTYFCHVVSMVMLLAAVGTLGAWRAWLAARQSGGRALLREGVRWLAGPLTAFLPTLLFMAAFLSKRAGARTTFLSVWVKLRQLLVLFSLVSLNWWTIVFSALLVAVFAWTAWHLLSRRRQMPGPQAGDGLLLVCGVFLLAYFLAPSEIAGGGFLVHRLNLYPFFALLLWFGTFEIDPRLLRRIGGAAAVVAAGFLAMFWPRWVTLNDYLAEYETAASRIEAGSTLLSLVYSHQGTTPEGKEIAFRTRPFLHASGYIADRKPLVDLCLYEANEDYFPILFRPEKNPFRQIGVGPGLGIEAEPPRVDFFHYPERTSGRVDYVLLWQLDTVPRDQTDVRWVLDQLAAGYDRIYVSPRRLVQLYRRRG